MREGESEALSSPFDLQEDIYEAAIKKNRIRDVSDA
jgi:hypothetical protein